MPITDELTDDQFKLLLDEYICRTEKAGQDDR